ncbi:MAG: ATP-binding protein, partial [Planctomycetes bacterium]|nr:ATP-binding protein [Planctomycetota bacterium]
MNATTEWTAGNQRHLMAELARVLAALTATGAPPQPTPQPPRPAQPESESSDDAIAPPASRTLTEVLGLSDFELDVVLLCAGIELSDDFASAVRELGGASFGLALARLRGAHWSAL